MAHELYAGTLSLATVFSFVALASIVIFIYYAADWQSHLDEQTSSSFESDHLYTARRRAENAYYGAVISLLFVLISMHSHVFTNIF